MPYFFLQGIGGGFSHHGHPLATPMTTGSDTNTTTMTTATVATAAAAAAAATTTTSGVDL